MSLVFNSAQNTVTTVVFGKVTLQNNKQNNSEQKSIVGYNNSRRSVLDF